MFKVKSAAMAVMLLTGSASSLNGNAQSALVSGDFAVGAQYDTTHVYVPVADFDRFVASFSATFGGTKTSAIELQVTPTQSRTRSQLVLTPSGSVSVFGFETPIPYPFGDERNGYLVSDMDGAVAAALKNGAVRRIATFPDPVGRDAVLQWPGGVNMQFYWHTKAPSYAALAFVPENRVYLSPEAADPFIRAWVTYSHARIIADDRAASGIEVGNPATKFRRVVIESGYGVTVVLVSDGTLPWPFGRDMTGYCVESLNSALANAKASGAKIVVPIFTAAGRRVALVQFPGGYVAEVHETSAR